MDEKEELEVRVEVDKRNGNAAAGRDEREGLWWRQKLSRGVESCVCVSLVVGHILGRHTNGANYVHVMMMMILFAQMMSG